MQKLGIESAKSALLIVETNNGLFNSKGVNRNGWW